ncbi:MAG: TerC family protein [Phycisphaerales bacterium]|nr:TerC family protein [Phycisphaerales bacterium]
MTTGLETLTLTLGAVADTAQAAAGSVGSATQHVAVGVDHKVWAYAIFLAIVVVFLALDLGVFHREAHEVSMKEAVGWSIVWVTCGLLFTVLVYFAYENHWLGLGIDTPYYATAEQIKAGASTITRGEVTGAMAAESYLTGYLIEKSLSMDNIFVIALIFSFFAIPAKYQHRVLFWGIMGALIMRGAMIGIGSGLIMKYQWVLIVFGGFLVLTALKMALIKGNDDPSQNIAVKLTKKIMPTVDFFDGQKFITRRTLKPTYSIDPVTGKEKQDPPPAGSLGKRAITPLFLALIMVEITDLVFAVDSIPAIFAITPDPFIVFTSNIFAILGLRALYFCLAALIAKFRFLKPALILILAFVGVKLLLLSVPPYLQAWGVVKEAMGPIKIDTTVSLVVVLATLGVATVLSVVVPAKEGGGGHK